MSAWAYNIAQNLPQGLSAEIADNFRSAGIELSGKKRIMGVFLIDFIGKNYQNRS